MTAKKTDLALVLFSHYPRLAFAQTCAHHTVDICIELDRACTLSLGGLKKRNEKISRGAEGASNLGRSAGRWVGEILVAVNVVRHILLGSNQGSH